MRNIVNDRFYLGKTGCVLPIVSLDEYTIAWENGDTFPNGQNEEVQVCRA